MWVVVGLSCDLNANDMWVTVPLSQLEQGIDKLTIKQLNPCERSINYPLS